MRLIREKDLSAFEREEWDALAARESFYLSYRWLRNVEHERTSDILYYAVDGDSGIAAAVPNYVVHRETNSFYDFRPQLDAVGLPRTPQPSFIIGARRCYQNGFLLPARADGEQRRAVDLLLEGLASACAEQGFTYALMPYVSSRTVRLVRELGVETVPIYLNSDANIRLPGSDFKDYLGSFPHKRRNQLQREIRAFEETWEVVERRLSECCTAAGPLLGNVNRRHGHDADDESLSISLCRQAHTLEDTGRVLTCRRNDAIVGFSLFYVFGDTLYLRALGFEYEKLAGCFEYFNLAYYHPIRAAYAAGCTKVHAGIEAFNAKVKRGARLAPLWLLPLFGPQPPAAKARAYNRSALSELIGAVEGDRSAIVMQEWEMLDAL